MLRLFLFCLLLGPLALPAQVFEKGIGLEIAPHFGNRRVSAGAGITFTELERQDSLESGRAGFSAGITYDVRADRFGFTTGVRYLETGYDLARQPTTLDPNSELAFSGTINSTYLSVPMEVNFHQSITPKDRVFFTLGIAANLHLNTVFTRTDFDGDRELGTAEVPNDPDVRFRSPVMSFAAGVGFDRKLGDAWTLRLQPNFNFFLQGNQQEDVNRTNRNYYQLGVRVIVRRLLGVGNRG